jgi:acetyl esterase/lipase
MKKTLLTALLAGAAALAQAAIPLWPEGVPNAKSIGAEKAVDGRITNVSEPTLTVYKPAVDRPTGTAVIICPGGGYQFVSAAREGEQYANYLSSLGVTAFVLKYRMAEFGHPAPLQDVLRAVRLVRSQAASYGIDPNRIGVMGSSAGGHLAATSGTLYDHALGRTGHALDNVSARPDFLILMYPVILMEGPNIHAGSRKALLGDAPSAASVNLMSVDKQVTSATPPTFLSASQDDGAVPVENSIVFYQALTRNKVPAEMYLYERGGHGMGMRMGQGNASTWPKRLEEWLRDRKLIAQ